MATKKAGTKKATAAKGTKAKSATAKAATSGAKARNKIDEAAKITVVGEHKRREGSRFHTGYELLRKAGTVGNFFKKGGSRDVLTAAVKEKFARVG
jgi:hypothetical protein